MDLVGFQPFAWNNISLLSGESLKKSHLMDSSSDIINMEEGGGVIANIHTGNNILSPRVPVDYPKVSWKTFHFVFALFNSRVTKKSLAFLTANKAKNKSKDTNSLKTFSLSTLKVGFWNYHKGYFTGTKI